MTKATNLLKAAIHYQELGYNVIPVGKDKKPIIPHWKKYQSQKVSAELVNQWWHTHPNANIGLLTGHINDLIVLDLDSRKSTVELQSLLGTKDIEHSTLACETGKGMHFYFAYPQGKKYHIPNAVRILPGVDIRADGGYVVVPPSIHQSGKAYKWVSDADISPFPTGIWRLLGENGTASPIDWGAAIPKGQRDAELTRRVGKLLQIKMQPAEVLTLMSAWNQKHCKPPLPDSQVRKIVNSISQRQDTTVSSERKTTFNVVPFLDALEKYGAFEQAWIIPDWLPSNTVGLVIAPPGGYKTWLLLALAFSVATGNPFLKRYPVKHSGPVLIIQQEDPFPLLFSRLCSIMEIGELKVKKDGVYELPIPTVENPNIFWHPDRLLNFSDPVSMRGMQSAIEKIRPQLVLIDPLYSAAATEDYMAKSAQQMLFIKSIRDKYGTSFLIAHHRKKGGQNDREGLWGSQFLNAWMETGWQITKTDPRAILLQRHFKSCLAVPSINLSFDITPHKFGVTIKESMSDESCKKKIAQLIQTEKMESQKDIVKAMAKEGVAVSNAMINKVLKEMGVLKQDGFYCIPDIEIVESGK